MFRDEINIRFKSGRGGDGHVSFGIDKKPNGGIGGDGGSIYVEGAQNEYDLSHLKAFQLFEGGNGEHGGKNHLKGATGSDQVLKLPLTTHIYDLNGNLMMTVDTVGERKLLLKGGRGGLGNHFYKKAHGVDLYRFTHGKPGEELECKLKLELYSDIIFIGLPNAGKSSILTQLTNADAKIGAYPFTTLIPQQGRMDKVTLMDLPGLIEGTHYGKGVGTKFVKHTKSSKLLAHFISAETQDISSDYKIIRSEIEKLGDDLSNKKEVVILTKTDLISSERLKELEKELKKLNPHYIPVSIYDSENMEVLRDFLRKRTMIILNLKTYPESTGKHAEDIVQLLESLIIEGTIQAEKFSVAPSILDLVHLRKQFRQINLMSQNVTGKKPGSTTGWATPEDLVSNEITFSLYNHSENRSFSDSFVSDIKDIQSRGVSLVVCVENLDEARLALEAGAFGIAYETKELIGSGISVTTNPETVTEFIELVQGKTMPFIGAGVTTGDDVRKCMSLGAKGVLLASAFVKAEDKKAKAIELLSY